MILLLCFREDHVLIAPNFTLPFCSNHSSLLWIFTINVGWCLYFVTLLRACENKKIFRKCVERKIEA